MSDYTTFCERYGLDPESEESRAQYREAQEALAALRRAAAGAEAREAIDKAKEER
ncbi:MAG: hypothetical protein ACLFSI_08745 [Halorhodospira sp.]